MTHNDLLTLLNSKSDSDEVHALRAVVELHKPQSGVNGHTCTCDPYNEYLMGYPCDTIQAIEKELN